MLAPDECDVTEPNIALPKCCIPGCEVVEPGVGEETCITWGNRRLCYANHFPAFSVHPLADMCSERGTGPTEDEWDAFVRTLGVRAA